MEEDREGEGEGRIESERERRESVKREEGREEKEKVGRRNWSQCCINHTVLNLDMYAEIRSISQILQHMGMCTKAPDLHKWNVPRNHQFHSHTR